MMPIDAVQRDQVRYSAVNLLVEAGAGTGKTTLLIDRVVDAAVRRGIPLSRMLLITFMDKAQEEMRQRLQSRLEELLTADGLSHEARQQVSLALQNLSDAAITTIHGFCRQLLTEFGVDFGIPVGFRVLDDIETEHLWQETFRAWVQQIEATAHRETIVHLLRAGIDWRHLQQWAWQISHWAQVPDVAAGFPDLARFVEKYAREAQHYWHRAEVDALTEDRGRDQIFSIVQEFEWLSRMPTHEWPRMLAQWTTGLSPRGAKKNWTHQKWLVEQKEWVQQLKEDLSLLRQQMSDAYLAQWVNLIGREFLPFWRKTRFETLALTYDDLLWEADRISRDAGVWSRIRARYQLILVDEFQDTDAVQASIIRRLVAPVGINQLSPDDQGRLFLVGDPKQSIYRFRGADVETYAAVRQELLNTGGQIVPISQNFRSQAPILHYVNELFARRWPSAPDADRPFVPVFYPLMPSVPGDERTRLRVVRLALGESAHVKREAEARDIADLVKQAVAEQWPVRSGTTLRPITYSDIAVIMPQRIELDVYRQALRSQSIPVSSQTGQRFFQQDEIRGLSQLFRALENPRDGLAAAAWLVSPWVGLSYDILLRHRNAGGAWNYLQRDAGDPQVLSWWEKLAHWHDQYWRVDAETVLDWAVQSSSLPLVLKEREDWAALANLAEMRHLCRTLGDRWGVWEFSQWFFSHVNEGHAFEEGPMPGLSDAVQMSTVHQAKGLEWPMVVVANWSPKKTALEPGIHYSVRLNRIALHHDPWKSRDWDDLDRDHREREKAEADRLLYVALTRARDYLWFYASFLDDEVLPKSE